MNQLRISIKTLAISLFIMTSLSITIVYGGKGSNIENESYQYSEPKYIALPTNEIKDHIRLMPRRRGLLSKKIPLLGYYLEIIDQNGKCNLKITPVEKNGALHYSSHTFTNLAQSKSGTLEAMIFQNISSNGGFLRNDLQFYSDEDVQIELMFISYSEFKFMVDNADYLVFSGSLVDFGKPIINTGFYRNVDGSIISKYFTFKVEGFNTCGSSDNSPNYLADELCLSIVMVEGKEGVYTSSSSNPSATVSMPMSTVSIPCPPRWHWGLFVE